MSAAVALTAPVAPMLWRQSYAEFLKLLRVPQASGKRVDHAGYRLA